MNWKERRGDTIYKKKPSQSLNLQPSINARTHVRLGPVDTYKKEKVSYRSQAAGAYDKTDRHTYARTGRRTERQTDSMNMFISGHLTELPRGKQGTYPIRAFTVDVQEREKKASFVAAGIIKCMQTDSRSLSTAAAAAASGLP